MNINSSLLGAVAILGSSVFWAYALLIFKEHGQKVSAQYLNLLKTFLTLIILCSICIFLNVGFSNSIDSYLWLLLSGVLGLGIGDNALLASLKFLGPLNSSLLLLLIPPFVTILGFAFLNESLLIEQLIGIALTLMAVGVLLKINHTRSQSYDLQQKRSFRLGLTAGLLAVLTQGLSTICTRIGIQDLDIWMGTILRLTGALAILIILQLTLYKKHSLLYLHRQLSPSNFRWLVLASFIGSALSLLLFTYGIKLTKAGISSALSCTTPLWVLLLSSLWYKQRLSLPVLFWTFMAIFGVTLMIIYEA